MVKRRMSLSVIHEARDAPGVSLSQGLRSGVLVFFTVKWVLEV